MSKPAGKSSTSTFVDRNRWALGIVLTLGLGAGAAVSGVKLRQYVERKYATPTVPPGIRLLSRPAWMNDQLAARIEGAAKPGRAASAFDHQLLLDVRDQLTSDPDVAPWIEQVRSIRRIFANAPGDTVEIDLAFRAPIALVKAGDDYWLTDSRRVKLQQINADDIKRVAFDPAGKPVMRVIDGVQTNVPDAGRPWPGDDVAAGMELLRTLFDRPCAEQIVRIDVSNFGGRADPNAAQLVLVTRYGTEIRWGQPVYPMGSKFRRHKSSPTWKEYRLRSTEWTRARPGSTSDLTAYCSRRTAGRPPEARWSATHDKKMASWEPVGAFSSMERPRRQVIHTPSPLSARRSRVFGV